MNVITTFLAENIDEEIYMKQSEEFEEKENLVCKFRKNLYDLKQSSHI